jgi:serine/threonine-protein kinase
MSLSPGSRIGAYEIAGLLGAGGMGEVYRARDTRLDRDVAIKILPSTFASDPERLLRFEREAKTLASLNHPNIASIYGVEGVDDANALVLELVDGPTLADLIAKGPLPLDDALSIARQIADALEAAHERDVIHRDLKPANVKVRRDGTVKVLDFGLAKILEDGTMASSSHITTPAMTEAGMILGTAAYMSPEQSRGDVVDRRSDVWAFGCVFYEMLTGRRAFEGEDLSDTLVAVRKADPVWSALPPPTPDPIRRLLRRCLAKDRKARLADIGSARLDIDEALASPADDDRPAMAATPRRSRRLWVPAIVALTAVLASAGTWLATRERPHGPIRLTIALADPRLTGASINNWDLAISPDGQRIVYLAGEGSSLQLYVRPLDQLEATMLPAGEDVVSPFFSPDGQSIGFVEESAGPANGVMKRIAITGGSPMTIAPVGGAIRGASWSPDGTIVFGTLDPKSGLWRVPGAGGTPEPLTPPPDADTDYYFPEVLPGGRAVLFTIVHPSGPLRGRFQTAVFDLSTREHKVLIEGGSHARYSASGHLVYAVDGTLRGIPFDLGSLQVRGEPTSVVEGVVTKVSGAADFAMAANGTLVYRTGSVFGLSLRTLLWVDRQGREEPVPAAPRRFTHLSLSPNGSQVALDAEDQQNDIWIWNFSRRILSRATFDPAPETGVVWTPDGKRIVYTKFGVNGLYWQMADGTGTPEQLTHAERPQAATSFSPDGRSLILHAPPTFPRDLFIAKIDRERTIEPLLATPFDEANGDISPDGRWMVYESNESGRREIFVRPFPNIKAGRWQVSTNGGMQPKWSRTGRELFYWLPTSEATGRLMVSQVASGPTFTSSPPKLVSDRSYVTGGPGRSYDVSSDGQRFLVINDAATARSSPAEFVVVLHWVEELKRLVATK